jgi:nitrilase
MAAGWFPGRVRSNPARSVPKMNGSFTVAAIQAASVMFNPDASTDKACRLIAEAGAAGASLACFGETWLPGYPRFINSPITYQDKRRFGARYLEASVYVPGPHIDRLCEAAREAGIDVVIGVAERDSVSSGTTYCTLLFIASDGTLLGKHRKLKPTYSERTTWGEGDASGLRVHQRPYARISGLNCWEHNMVLPGYVLMAEGTQVHVAAFPGHEPEHKSSTRQLLLARAFASQGACYVVLVGGLINPGAFIDDDIRDAAAMLPEMNGGTYVIDPQGEVVAGPAQGEETLFVELNHTALATAKSMTDIAGHYSRPDVLRVVVNRGTNRRLIVEGE